MQQGCEAYIFLGSNDERKGEMYINDKIQFKNLNRAK